MNSEPDLDWLVRLAPNGSKLDPAEVIFHAGRGSARTPWGWKVAVVGLVLVNALTLVILLPRRAPPPPRESIPVPVAVPLPVAPPPSESAPDPNSIASMTQSFDPDSLPFAGFVPPDHPVEVLTVGSRNLFN